MTLGNRGHVGIRWYSYPLTEPMSNNIKKKAWRSFQSLAASSIFNLPLCSLLPTLNQRWTRSCRGRVGSTTFASAHLEINVQLRPCWYSSHVQLMFQPWLHFIQGPFSSRLGNSPLSWWPKLTSKKKNIINISSALPGSKTEGTLI